MKDLKQEFRTLNFRFFKTEEKLEGSEKITEQVQGELLPNQKNDINEERGRNIEKSGKDTTGAPRYK